ncbi:F-box/LRR-repeat protein [Capsicum baccatum]|uniref:F-box/LRR-repeat protein n=1 Tax=Capsicum baccatum TaxID=33114 RepID=A0A2G2VPW5_CAPBA|nr:F-box/LRR-repeat protein [Capsicum baccatum]
MFARDVIVTSATCRMWREACEKHLHTLSFNSHDWPLYRDLSTSRLEILITQTTRLQALDLNLLLTASLKIEILALVNPEIAMSDAQWVAGLLQRCPNLTKLVIHGVVSETKTHEECQMLAGFTSSIVQLMKRYMHVDVQFEFE